MKLKEDEMLEERKNSPLTFIDLFRYKSLRKVSIFSMIIFLSNSIMYFIPNNLTNQFGFDFFVNGFLLFGTELITIPVALYLISRLKRKKFLMACALVMLACSLMLIPLDKSYICTHNCWTARLYGELVVFFILRFFSSLSFINMYVYCF